jgi:hypothetical protein
LERGSAGDVAKKHKIAAPKFLRIWCRHIKHGMVVECFDDDLRYLANENLSMILSIILLFDPTCRAADIRTAGCEPSLHTMPSSEEGIAASDLIKLKEARLPGSFPLSLT